MNWLNRLDRKYHKYSIPNLMYYIVGANAVVFILSLIDKNIVSRLTFDFDLIMQGEVWRILSFMIIPPDLGWFAIFVLLLYYTIGSSLEHEWGTFKFNVYFFFGAICTIISAIVIRFVVGYSIPMGNYYLYLSLFLAFARLFPDFTIMLFFILPVKIKYLGWISWGFLALSLLSGSIPMYIMVLFGMLNYIVFFGNDIIHGRKNARSAYKRKEEFRRQNKANQRQTLHRCEVCGRTEKDDPDLEFRFCSKCNGEHEYCIDHLYNHEHK